MDGYYYKRLERAEKAAYEQMKTGLEALAPSCLLYTSRCV